MELEIKDLTREIFEERKKEFLELEPNWTELGEEEWSEENFLMDIDKKWELSVFALVDGRVAGYAIVSFKGVTRLNKILVDRNLRRHGIATKLWDRVLEKCREFKIDKLDFKILVDNGAAIDFYRRAGCLFDGTTTVGSDGLERYNIQYIFLSERIGHSKPTTDLDDVEKIKEVVLSGNLAKGVFVDKFISDLKNYVGRKYGVATNSGTSALFLALKALGVSEGDEVIIPDYCCVSVMQAVKNAGATPVVVDVGLDANISLEEIKKNLNEKTKAIVVPHMFGNFVKDIDDFVGLGVPIIEDCAQAIGGKKIGGFGLISIFSFYATKVLATGTGGAVLTDDEVLAEKLEKLMQHDKCEGSEGYNLDMDDIRGALGVSQLKKLDSFIERRREIAKMYTDLLSKNKSDFVFLNSGEGIFFRYVLKCDDADLVKENLRRRGVDVAKPVFRPLHSYLGLPDEDFPNTINLYKSVISVPIYPLLKDEEVKDVAGMLLNWRFENEK